MPHNKSDTTLSADTAIEHDAQGQAALLLAESLILALCQKGLLRIGDDVEIVQRAMDVQLDQLNDDHSASSLMWKSYGLLRAIAVSLKIDEI